MSEAKPCRIAVIGAGPLVGHAHCKTIAALAEEGLELACICQRRPDDTKLAEIFGVPLYTDAFEMACKEALDGVVIAAPTHVHLDLTRACIEGAKRRQLDTGSSMRLRAVLVEKPLCQDLQSAVELLGITEAAGVDVLVGHQRRHSSFVRKAKEIVTDKNFGPLRGVTMEFSLLKPDSYFCAENPTLEWRRRKGVGGPVLINSIHDLDLMRYITGHEITQVFAMTSSAARGHDVEDSGAITVTFDHGAVGTLFFTDAAPSPWSYEFTTGENKKYPPVPESDQRDCYHFMGAQRSMGFPSGKTFSYAPDEKERGWDAPLSVDSVTAEMEDPLRVQMAHFARLCRGLEGSVCSGRDAVESLAVVMAVLRSAELGVPVAPSELLMEVNTSVMADAVKLPINSSMKEKLSISATSLPTDTKLWTTNASETGNSELGVSVAEFREGY